MKIYLMRHGETKWNKRSKLQGQVDIPLAPKGIEQAEMTSEGMKDIPFDHIFSSPLKRAYKTAQVVRRDRPIEIVRDDRLKEMSFGTSEGKIIGKIMANPQWFVIRDSVLIRTFPSCKVWRVFSGCIKENR